MDFPALNGNWVDLAILVILLFFILGQVQRGFVHGLFDLVGFILSFLTAIRFYSFGAKLLMVNFSLSRGIANAFGFFMVASIAELILSILSIFLYTFVPKKIAQSKLNAFTGFIPPLLSGMILVAFFLSTFLSLPVRPNIKQDIINSRIGGYLAKQTLGLESHISKIFGGAVEDALTFLTVKPQGNESVDLKFMTKEFSIDETSEGKMFELVNLERQKQGVKFLTSDIKLQEISRNHCRDMFKRGYFSHYTPEGLSPFDRMDNAGYSYQAAGENLAYAPNVDIAHTGLMNSPGHKANILSVDFGKAGVGIIDAGIFGKMFCQTFAD